MDTRAVPRRGPWRRLEWTPGQSRDEVHGVGTERSGLVADGLEDAPAGRVALPEELSDLRPFPVLVDESADLREVAPARGVDELRERAVGRTRRCAAVAEGRDANLEKEKHEVLPVLQARTVPGPSQVSTDHQDTEK